MSDSRTDAALARIDRALTRIAAQATRPAVGSGEDGELAKLRTTHEDLRTAVGESLAELDTLIARIER